MLLALYELGVGISERIEAMAILVDDILAEVRDTRGVVDSTATMVDTAIGLIQSLHDKLDKAGTDPAKLQAIKDELLAARDSIAASKDRLAAAVAANPLPDDGGGTGGSTP